MAIEINNIPPASAQVSEVGGHNRNRAQDQSETAQAVGTTAATRGDQVSLTPTAQQLRSLEQQIAAQPVVDSTKVNATREALTQGRLEVNAERIAGKMMSLEKALGDLG